MISYHTHSTFFCITRGEKICSSYRWWFERFRGTGGFPDDTMQQISITVRYFLMTCFSNPALPHEILSTEVCWCRLWSLWPCLSSAALRLCQPGSNLMQHVFQAGRSLKKSRFPCPAYRQQWWLFKNPATACSAVIHLLACHMLRVTPQRKRCCARVDTGTPALICDTCQWTNRDKSSACRQMKPCVVRQAVLTTPLSEGKKQRTQDTNTHFLVTLTYY